MNKIDVVKDAMLSQNDRSDKSYLYADHFQATNSIGEPAMDKLTWLAMTPMMAGSFPDFDYVVEDMHEDNDGVRVTGHFVGTFTNDLDLSAMGAGVVPATGKKVTWPTSHSLVSVENDKITRWHGLDTGADAGMPGFLRPLGVG